MVPVHGSPILRTPPSPIVVLWRGTSRLVTPQTVARDNRCVVQEDEDHQDDDKRNDTPTDSQTWIRSEKYLSIKFLLQKYCPIVMELKPCHKERQRLCLDVIDFNYVTSNAIELFLGENVVFLHENILHYPSKLLMNWSDFYCYYQCVSNNVIMFFLCAENCTVELTYSETQVVAIR